MDLATRLGVLRRLVDPMVIGIEHLPHERAMLVGNHAVWALDTPFLMIELAARGYRVHGLGDRAHFKIPVWRDLATSLGVVPGTPEACAALMHDGALIAVMPGGTREVMKTAAQRYRLLWGERLGFARLAIEHGYPIVPYANVGPDDLVSFVADRDTRFWPASFPPLVRPTRLERVYVWFGQPIDPTGADPAELRDRVRASVEGGIELLLAERDQDPRRRLLGRLLDRQSGEASS